ncbi:hypothetical protein D9615_008948 [Tricholomella constricta]|uniref:Protein kinase domain-containing protein n=1 Tax=Tricholomella constricta TaxID=117010 RepID=A0A8H5H1I1_9AGAR|nr:hypothetical protein D9615_008948 [Tricholomella constricta]
MRTEDSPLQCMASISAASNNPGSLSPAVPSSSNRIGSLPHDVAVEVREWYQFDTVLSKDEAAWRDRYSFLLSRGYRLRSRYEPGWAPSWVNLDIDPAYCDDSIDMVLPMVLDAKRLSDGATVCIKRIDPKESTDEVKIAKYLSSVELTRDPKNHCVVIWDHFKDPIIPKVEFIVMRPLRRYADPEFGAVGEVVDFVTQLIEGMEFMHKHLVAHGDLTTQNIMMDARPILPSGWHFVAHNCTLDGVTPVSPLARIDYPVRYVIIDFDCSVRLSPGQPRLITNFGGRDGDPPEYKSRDPYDPFKIDVFTLGNVFFKDFYKVYEGLDFLAGLIDIMKAPNFRQRPDAEAAMKYWLNVRSHIDVGRARWRLQKRNETLGERVVYGAVAFAREGVHRMKHMLSGEGHRVYWS